MKVRYDTFKKYQDKFNCSDVPCIVYSKIRLTSGSHSSIANWHEDLEIQLCVEGEGYVVINGKKTDIKKGDMVVVNSNAAHYTDTDSTICYYPCIINSKFCGEAGINCALYTFEALISNASAVDLAEKTIELYYNKEDRYRQAKLQASVLNLLVTLCEEHILTESGDLERSNLNLQIISAINYIKGHYNEKITLDTIADYVHINKYTLSRNFKSATSLTVFEYINMCRCEIAKGFIREGVPINEVAIQSGFNNVAFFTKTFKKHIGMLPSEYKRENR